MSAKRSLSLVRSPRTPEGSSARVVSIVERASCEESWACGDLTLCFQRRYHQRAGRGFWRDWSSVGRSRRLPWSVNLQVPPVAEWTRDTVVHVLAIAKAQLVLRGAKGTRRIAVRADPYEPNAVGIVVRIGDLRTSIEIEAGIVRYRVPPAVLFTLAELVPSSVGLRQAVASARERALEAAGKGGA
jgi:hypothetical protein